MSLALKRKLPKIYSFLKKYERFVPAWTLFWDKKKYFVNLKIISIIRYWRHYPRLKAEAEVVYKEYKGGDFIDVGAFEGIYSIILAPKAKSGDVFISCEPNLDLKKSLGENLKTLKRIFKNINFISYSNPIGNGKSVVKKLTEYGHPVFIYQKNQTSEINSQIEIIKSTSLDDLISQNHYNPKFIKIDVEGAELDILEGMKKLLMINNPTIMLEKHPGLLPKDISVDQIDNFLKEKGYFLEKEIFKDEIAITEIWKKKFSQKISRSNT